MLRKLIYVSAARPLSYSAHAVYVNHLLNAVARGGIECELIAPAEWGHAVATRQTNFGVRLISCFPPVRFRYYVMAVRLLLSTKLRGGPAALYVTHNGLFAVVLLLRGLPVLYDVHAAVATRIGRVVTRWIAKHPRCVAISVVSDGMRRHLAEAGVDHPHTILRRNGVSVSATASPSNGDCMKHSRPSRFVVAYSGNLEPARGIDLLLKVAPLVANEVTFRIVGGSPAEVERLRSQAQLAGLSERFELLGKVPHDQVADHLRTADALMAIYTARVRNVDVMCPMKLLEYFALGLPIIAPDFSTVRELVNDGSNGLLYRPGDATQLAAVITRVQEDRSLRETLGQQGLASAGELTWERNAQALVCGANSALNRP